MVRVRAGEVHPSCRSEDHKPYTIKDDDFRATYYEIVGQYGTHVDPPAHFDEKGSPWTRSRSNR